MKTTRSGVSFRRRASGLFDQQLWCLGRDIQHPQGNILLELGLCQYREPGQPVNGCTMYSGPLDDEATLTLWGFGVLIVMPESPAVFIRRYDFQPKFCNPPTCPIHDMDRLGSLANPVNSADVLLLRDRLPRLCEWFARYEHWIAETHGIMYRANVLAARAAKRPPVETATNQAAAWARLAKGCSRYRESISWASPWAKLLGRCRPVVHDRTVHRPSTRVL
jgi:hypothetical protein